MLSTRLTMTLNTSPIIELPPVESRAVQRTSSVAARGIGSRGGSPWYWYWLCLAQPAPASSGCCTSPNTSTSICTAAGVALKMSAVLMKERGRLPPIVPRSSPSAVLLSRLPPSGPAPESPLNPSLPPSPARSARLGPVEREGFCDIGFANTTRGDSACKSTAKTRRPRCPWPHYKRAWLCAAWPVARLAAFEFCPFARLRTWKSLPRSTPSHQ